MSIQTGAAQPAIGKGNAVRVFSIALVLLLFSSGAAESQAQLIYAVDVATDQLLTVNPTNGIATPVKSLAGFETIDGIAFDNNGVLYGAEIVDDNLLIIDPSVGATIQGPLNTGIVAGLAFTDDDDTLYGIESQTAHLLTIDTVTGNATPFAMGLGYTLGTGLAFDSSGTLYGVTRGTSQLYTINTTSGVGTPVGVSGVGVDNVMAIAFDASDILYAVSRNGTFMTIDTTDGTGDVIGSLGFTDVRALAVSPVPEPSTFGLCGFACLGALAIAFRRRSQRRRSA